MGALQPDALRALRPTARRPASHAPRAAVSGMAAKPLLGLAGYATRGMGAGAAGGACVYEEPGVGRQESGYGACLVGGAAPRHAALRQAGRWRRRRRHANSPPVLRRAGASDIRALAHPDP